jgi:hypothetical protein
MNLLIVVVVVMSKFLEIRMNAKDVFKWNSHKWLSL